MIRKEQTTFYQIHINDHLDDRWLSLFEGYVISQQPNGETLIIGEVTDQAALFGILNRIRDLGLELISVQRCLIPDGIIDIVWKVN
jgi:hypothetical protein